MKKPSPQRPFAKPGEHGGQGINAQRPFATHNSQGLNAQRSIRAQKLRAPFPYFGGKSSIAELVWQKFGNVTTYVEPFAGSLAVLLGNPHPAKREIVADTHAAICNFWRAVKADPEGVARHAAWPTLHDDLTARHRWLVEFFSANSHRFAEDSEHYDVKAAGWWCWGISIWIGGNFCDYERSFISNRRPQGTHAHKNVVGVIAQRDLSSRYPSINPLGGGKGTNAQNISTNAQRPLVNHLPGGVGTNAQAVSTKRPLIQTNDAGSGSGTSAQSRINSQRPHVTKSDGAGSGTSAQRRSFNSQRPFTTNDNGAGTGVSAQRQGFTTKRPLATNDNGAGAGVSAQRKGFPPMPELGVEGQHLAAIVEWLAALSDRLFRVVVINRSWENLLSPTILGATKEGKARNNTSAVFLDPPYSTELRNSELYKSDADGSSHDSARESYEWALANGDRLKIAYCMAERDWEIPDGWESYSRTFRSSPIEGQRRKDVVMFSPACNDDKQDVLF